MRLKRNSGPASRRTLKLGTEVSLFLDWPITTVSRGCRTCGEADGDKRRRMDLLAAAAGTAAANFDDDA